MFEHNPSSRLPDIVSVALSVVLYEDWDPIGINDVPECKDEYDWYLDPIRSLLEQSASREIIATHLAELERTVWGFTPRPPDYLLRVADKLVAAYQGKA